MFKTEGTYYLVTSGATGWDPNPARYATSQNILGQFTHRGNPVSGTGAGAANTYRSQSTNVIPVDQARNKCMFMGDRWTPSDLANAPYVWMPMSFGEGGSLSIGPDQEWTLEDLQPYTRWTVDTTIPDHVWLNDTSTLPSQVTVKTGARSEQLAVTWDSSTVAHPGPANLRGTLALLNSNPEQPLGTDPVTGKTWGLRRCERYCRYCDRRPVQHAAIREEPRAARLYTFEGLEPGTYTVHTGYSDPWPWANRAAQVTVNGTVVDQQRLFSSSYEAAEYGGIVVGADGKVTVTVAPTRSPDIQLSWLMVARDN